MVNANRLTPTAVFSSAFLLALAFPKFYFGWTIWFALAPAFFAVFRAPSYKEAFLIFYAVGFIFFVTSMEWIRHVSVFGWLFVCSVLAIYYGIFGICAKYFLNFEKPNLGLAALPSAWVFLEFIRTEIPTWALGWNLLGYSQSNFLPVARLASWFGVYGVSFLIVFINLTIWVAAESFVRSAKRLRAIRKLLYAVLLVAIVWFYFGRERQSPAKPAREISVSVIQGNIPQVEKWNAEVKSEIIMRHIELSKLAAAGKPDLIVWPESAWPGIFNLDPEAEKILDYIRSAKTSFLIGSPYEERSNEFQQMGRIFNSAYLINPSGETIERYDKIRLVPFGEFVPLAPLFNLFGLEKYAYSLGVGDFSAGSDFKIFRLKAEGGESRFSTLICFEDVFPELSRQFAKRGAEFLIVITNDAWFGKSAAPYQHLQASVFRAIENGVPVIRAANTGVSAFISPSGEVVDRVKDSRASDTWIAGGLTRSVVLGVQPTFYQKAGWLFPGLCVILLLGAVSWLKFSRR